MTEIRIVPLDRIIADPRLQSRAALNRETVTDYAEHYHDGVDMPPVVVFLDDKGNHWLADGFHRVAAAKDAGLAEIPSDLRDGDFRDALLHAAGANAAHGVRRTNKDKRRAVELLLSDPEWAGWSDREIARHCGVSHVFVATVRSLVTDASEASRTVVPFRNKHGGFSTMNVANIGKGRRKAPAPPPAPPAMELPDLHEAPRPCPFCLKTDTRLGFDDGTGTRRVFCVACTAIGPGGDTEERAVFEWNCRQ